MLILNIMTELRLAEIRIDQFCSQAYYYTPMFCYSRAHTGATNQNCDFSGIYIPIMTKSTMIILITTGTLRYVGIELTDPVVLEINSSRQSHDFSRQFILTAICMSCSSERLGCFNSTDTEPLNVRVKSTFVDFRIKSSISV